MADKKNRDKTLKASSRLLTELLLNADRESTTQTQLKSTGLSDDILAPELLDVLSGALQGDGSELLPALRAAPQVLLEGVLGALVASSNARALATIRDGLPGRDAQKSAARALHLLSARGVAVAPLRPAGASPQPWSLPLDEFECYLLPFNDGGVVFTSWAFLPQYKSPTLAATVKLSFSQGVLSVHLDKDAPRAARRTLHTMAKSDRMSRFLTPIPPSHLLFLLEEGSRNHERNASVGGVALMPDLSELVHVLRDEWGIVPQQLIPSWAAEVEPLIEPQHPGLEELLKSFGVLSWTLDESLLERLILRILEIASSSLVVSPEMRSEQIREATKDALREDPSREARRYQLRRLLEEHALLLSSTEWLPVARAAWGSAKALSDPTIPFEEVPFAWRQLELQAMVSLTEIEQRHSQQAGDNEPFDAPAERSSGIILP